GRHVGEKLQPACPRSSDVLPSHPHGSPPTSHCRVTHLRMRVTRNLKDMCQVLTARNLTGICPTLSCKSFDSTEEENHAEDASGWNAGVGDGAGGAHLHRDAGGGGEDLGS